MCVCVCVCVGASMGTWIAAYEVGDPSSGFWISTAGGGRHLRGPPCVAAKRRKRARSAAQRLSVDDALDAAMQIIRQREADILRAVGVCGSPMASERHLVVSWARSERYPICIAPPPAALSMSMHWNGKGGFFRDVFCSGFASLKKEWGSFISGGFGHVPRPLQDPAPQVRRFPLTSLPLFSCGLDVRHVRSV